MERKSRDGSERSAVTDLGLAVRLLPTPTTEPMTGNGHARNLGGEVKALLPTPTARDHKDGVPCEAVEENGLLGRVVWRMLPTPRTSDANGSGAHGDGGDDLRTTVDRHLPTPRANADRASRASLTREGHWSAPSLAQAVELANGQLPREYETWDEVQGWHGATTPPPSPVTPPSSDDLCLPLWTSEDD